MTDTLILDLEWPTGLDPESVPFATGTETVLRRVACTTTRAGSTR